MQGLLEVICFLSFAVSIGASMPMNATAAPDDQMLFAAEVDSFLETHQDSAMNVLLLDHLKMRYPGFDWLVVFTKRYANNVACNNSHFSIIRYLPNDRLLLVFSIDKSHIPYRKLSQVILNDLDASKATLSCMAKNVYNEMNYDCHARQDLGVIAVLKYFPTDGLPEVLTSAKHLAASKMVKRYFPLLCNSTFRVVLFG